MNFKASHLLQVSLIAASLDVVRSMVTELKTDVVIIGGGMSGIAAAHRLEQRTRGTGDICRYVVLEQQNRIGGRMFSPKDFGENGPGKAGGWTIERGASNIFGTVGTDPKHPENPVFSLAKKYDVDYFMANFSSWELYDLRRGRTDRVPDDVTRMYRNLEVRKFECLKRVSATFQEEFGEYEAEKDPGAIRALAQNCSFPLSNALRQRLKWGFVDVEYGDVDTSLNAFGELELWGGLDNVAAITDQRGYEVIPQMYAQELENYGSVLLNMKVTRVKWREVSDVKGYPAVVEVLNTKTNKRFRYFTRKVITTVSAGVLENERAMFKPRLPTKDLPYYMTVNERIYYQFPKKFWGNMEFIPHIWPKNTGGVCNAWQSFDISGRTDAARVMEGSNILLCELMHQDLFKVAPDGQLTTTHMKELLDPLRNIFGDKFVEPIHMTTNRWANDSISYGSFENWKTGHSFERFYRFFRPRKNSDGDRTLYHSGTGYCLASWGFTVGAFLAGEKAADLVLRDFFGYQRPESICDLE